MAASLADWHQLLDKSFQSLRAARDLRVPGSPVFALEHGLPDNDYPEFAQDVQLRLSGGRLPSDHWLPIVVYAAEIGYKYQGDEYWPVFEAETPGWRERGSSARTYIRKKYELFSDRFTGARPSGPWAEWFKNIAWPITHAILPADLQRHLARLLYDYRGALTAELLHDHEALGERLSSRSGGTSTRFQKFAENTSLLGLVAASLLLDEEEDTGLLRREALHRVVLDLSHERQAGEWLRDARKSAVRVRRRGFLGSGGSTDRTERPASAAAELRTEVALEVRRRDGAWEVMATIPSHGPLAERFPDLGDELNRIRYRVPGVDGVQPRGGLMYRRGPLAIADMPRSGCSMISPEGASIEVERVLQDSCHLPPAPWVFRLRDKGLGVHVRTSQVRPAEEYLFVSNSADVEALSSYQSETSLTSGVQAWKLQIPDEVGSAELEELRGLGLGFASAVRVWPAGLFPASWDGEGRVAWRLGEVPVLGIESRRTASKCVISGEEWLSELRWPEASTTLFVSLPGLDAGVHNVSVLLQSDSDEHSISEGRLEVAVLQPADSSADASARQGLSVRCEPVHPTMDQIWSGGSAVVADGPRGERVRFDVSLTTRGGRKVLASAPFSSELPVAPERWAELLRGAQGAEDFRSSIAEAEAVSVSASNATLGRSTITAERPFSPLRWFGGVDNRGPFAQLIDHSDREDVHLKFYDARSPGDEASPAIDEDGLVRSEYGGLALAIVGRFRAGIVLPPHVAGGLEALKRLSVRPRLSTGSRCADSVRQMVSLAALWTGPGQALDRNAEQLQDTVNAAIVARSSGMIAGDRWWEIERKALAGEVPSMDALCDAIGSAPAVRQAASRLAQLVSEAPADPARRADVFAEALQGIEQRRLELTQVLQLASLPGSLTAVGEDIEPMVSMVLGQPSIHRLARLFVLGLGCGTADSASTTRSWPWPR